jgi:hypothetical protein
MRLSSGERDFVAKFSRFLDSENLPGIVNAMNDCVGFSERNANLKIMFLNLSLYIGREFKAAETKKKQASLK